MKVAKSHAHKTTSKIICAFSSLPLSLSLLLCYLDFDSAPYNLYKKFFMMDKKEKQKQKPTQCDDDNFFQFSITGFCASVASVWFNLKEIVLFCLFFSFGI